MLIPSSAQKHIALWQVGGGIRSRSSCRTLQPPLLMLEPNLKDYKHLRHPGDPFDRKNAVLLLVCNNVSNEPICDDFLVVGKPVDEGGIA